MLPKNQSKEKMKTTYRFKKIWVQEKIGSKRFLCPKEIMSPYNCGTKKGKQYFVQIEIGSEIIFASNFWSREMMGPKKFLNRNVRLQIYFCSKRSFFQICLASNIFKSNAGSKKYKLFFKPLAMKDMQKTVGQLGPRKWGISHPLIHLPKLIIN